MAASPPRTLSHHWFDRDQPDAIDGSTACAVPEAAAKRLPSVCVFGRAERSIDKLEVTGSSPVPPITLVWCALDAEPAACEFGAFADGRKPEVSWPRDICPLV